MLDVVLAMTRAYEDEEIALPLLRRSHAKAVKIGAEDDTEARSDYRKQRSGDRLQPATAGALMGLLAGAAGLGVVHALHLTRIAQGISRLGTAWDLPPDATVPLAYLAAALGGAIVGMGFASITRHLRRFIPLLIWALIFFLSLTTLVLAISAAYGRGLGVSMAPAILAASAAYAFIASFQLPLRKRS